MNAAGVRPLLTVIVVAEGDDAAAVAGRIREVARLPTEVLVAGGDGAPGSGLDELVRAAAAPTVAVVAAGCRVEPGWDLVLFEAASQGLRLAVACSPAEGGGAPVPVRCFAFAKELHERAGGVGRELDDGALLRFADAVRDAGLDVVAAPAARVRTDRSTSPPALDALPQHVGSFREAAVGPAPDPDRPRVFFIGLNKTGTSSFHEAMGTLGYESLHWGGPPIRQLVEVSRDEGAPLLSRLDPAYDAFSDIEVLSTNFDLLDRQYPGSAFVLTVRELDAWIDSRRRHVEANRRRKAQGAYHGTFLDVDEPAWRKHWLDHVGRVRSYFEGRDDFVEIDVSVSPSWGPLCELLGVDVPPTPFPWANRGAPLDV